MVIISIVWIFNLIELNIFINTYNEFYPTGVYKNISTIKITKNGWINKIGNK